jgi:hypothetical protein
MSTTRFRRHLKQRSGTTVLRVYTISYNTVNLQSLAKTSTQTWALQNTTDAVSFSAQMYIIQTYTVISGSVLLLIEFLGKNKNNLLHT